MLRARTTQPVCVQFAVLSYTRVPPHLAQISGRYLSHILLPGCRRRTACRVDTYEMTVSPRPRSSVRPHADRMLRPIANFVPTTELFYSIDYYFIFVGINNPEGFKKNYATPCKEAGMDVSRPSAGQRSHVVKFAVYRWVRTEIRLNNKLASLSSSYLN